MSAVDLRRPDRPRPRPPWLADVERLDVAVYAAIAATPSPALDSVMGRLTRAADHSKLSLAAAAVLAVFGGAAGRRAATGGLAAVGVTATLVNVGLKLVARRRRPDPVAAAVPITRQINMPVSHSFPSGHSAAAFAFATGVGGVLPGAAIPLRALASVVAYSRVHTGVHYPSDVIAGALVGVSLAELMGWGLRRRMPG
jgi:membrane-associated phospholipid phosphatase